MSWNAQSAIQKLDGFQRALPEESDRWSPRRPSRSAQSQAKMLISRITDQSLPDGFIQATIDGGINFEWTVGERELCIGISPAGEISYLKAVFKAPAAEGPLELANLDALIDWLLYGR
jgi:hypothetical protein